MSAMAVRGGRDTSGGGDCGSEAGVSTRRRGAPPSAACWAPAASTYPTPTRVPGVGGGGAAEGGTRRPHRTAASAVAPASASRLLPSPVGVRCPWLRVEGRRLGARLRPRPSGVGRPKACPSPFGNGPLPMGLKIIL
jgi:hypothetical protein